MTEDQMGSGRPRKNTRRSNGNNSFQRSSNGIADIPQAQVIVEPLSNAASENIQEENEESTDTAPYSPTKPEESSEICALCNCGQEMALILGQITQYSVAPGTLKKLEKTKNENAKTASDVSSSDSSQKDSKEKTLFKHRRRRMNADFDSNLPPDMTTFGTANTPDFTDILDTNGCLFAHHCCAAWSAGVSQNDSYDLENVDRAVAKALTKKCSHCQRYGASVECQVHRCNKIFHYPCCASAGAFQDINSMNLLCPDHLDRTEKLADADPSCDSCAKTENLNLQLFCTSCGRHFHSYCVEMTIPITPVVRMGWQCSYCKVCQGCKQPGDEDRMLCCDHCDKGFHTYCLDPPITSVPKSVWKCVSCRKCDDCGSMKPGGGPSCRWHNNFTLCDRCYQQRKKGQCCPICTRAVRLCNNVEILQCTRCLKCVHKECDPDNVDDKYICSDCFKEENPDEFMEIQDIREANINDENASLPKDEETNDSYDYDLLASGQKKLTIEEAELFSMAASKDFIDSCTLNDNNNFHTDGIETEDAGENSRQGSEDFEGKYDFPDEKFSESTVDSPYSSVMSESFTDQSHTNFFPSVRRGGGKARRFKKSGRGTKRRVRNGSLDSCPVVNIEQEEDISTNNSVEELPDSTSQYPVPVDVPESVNTDDEEDYTEEDNEDGLHSTVLIVSTRDSFTLKQDVCMCCGSFGKGREGYLIGCVQCGQCFHPYCVNVKVNEVILSRGWRCIDCTVCEGCGRNADEAHLLLCDICDVSFHTYCLEPPLEEVPVGGWKCQWCVVCEDCGIKEPGFGCSWMGNYSQCGQCSSEQYCSICSYAYEDSNLVIQCEKCNRWAHAECDGLNSEEDAKLACSMTYQCVHCRPKTKHLGIYSSLKTSVITKVSIKKALNSNQIVNTNNKKTKTLHNLKTQKLSRAALREQKRAEEDAMPLVPHNATVDESGVSEIDLNLLKSRIRCDETIRERLHLTDAGLKQIKGLVIRAPPVRNVEKKSRSRKKEDNKGPNTIMSEEVTCSSIDATDDHSMDKIEPAFEGENISSTDQDLLSPETGSMSIKQEEGMEIDMLPPDTTEAEDLDTLDNDDEPEPEDTTDPFEFFGVNLLEKHLHMELENISSGNKKKKSKKEKRKEKRLRREAKNAFFTGPCVPDPTALSLYVEPKKPKQIVLSPTLVEPKIEEQAVVEDPDSAMEDPEIPVNEEPVAVPSPIPDVVDATPVADPVLAIEIESKDPMKHPLEIKMDISPPITSEMATPPIDLMSQVQGQHQDLPHVDGHEMAQLLAGIESEQTLPPNMGVDGFPHAHMVHQSVMQNFDPLHGMPKQNMMSVKSPILSPNSQVADPFKAIFGEEKDDVRILGAPRVDAQKQLRKWETDEKLGDCATISPVLYANMAHREELMSKYRDWPSRARAIARLWRKLPADQREPYRLKARENRVKLKENRKKKTAGKDIKPIKTNSMSPVSNLPPDFPVRSGSLSQVPTTLLQQVVHPDMMKPQVSDTGLGELPSTHTTPGFGSAHVNMEGPGFPHAFLPTSERHTPKIENMRTPLGATVLTVPEPQQLSPLLQKISPPFAISSLSNVVRSSPSSPYIPLNSPYPPNTPSTPHTPNTPLTPATPISDSASNKSDAPDSGTKEKKKKTKLTKQEREQNKLMRDQKKKLQDKKEQQWKLMQQQRIFEQQRQAILSQSKAMVMDTMHPSQRFNATLNSSLAEDALKQTLLMKAKTVPDNELNQSVSPPNEGQQSPSISSVNHTPASQAVSTSTSNSRPASSAGDILAISASALPLVQNAPGSKSSVETSCAGTLSTSTPFPPKDHHQHLQQQQPLHQGMGGGKPQMESFNPGMTRIPGQDHFPDGTELDPNVDPIQFRNSEQQKAFLYQQQYMASQQQYIQWQLTQQAAGNLHNQLPKTPKSALDGKDLPNVDNEEQHQERLRMLFNQRQFHKEPAQFMKAQMEQAAAASKRTGGIDPLTNQPYPYQDNRPGAMNYGGYPSSRMQPGFPAGNTPEAAIYHQIFMEYLMRYRKGQEMDQNAQIPPNQLYMMAEIAKQYYARQMQYGKGYPPPHPPPSQAPHMNPSYPYPRPPYDDRHFPPFGGPPVPGSNGGLTPTDQSAPTSVSRQPSIPTSSVSSKPEAMKSPPQSIGHGSLHGGPPKSASFQISRIAADSTSNDDFPAYNEKISRDNERANVGSSSSTTTTTTSENEISSSKSSRTLSDSTDSGGQMSATVNDENRMTSAVTGHHQESEDERKSLNRYSERRSSLCPRSNRTHTERVASKRIVRPYPNVCFDDEDEILGRCSNVLTKEWSDEEDWSEEEEESDDDRCHLDNQPKCTMGLLPEEDNEFVVRGRLQSSGSVDDNNSSSAHSSRPGSRQDVERRSSTDVTSTSKASQETGNKYHGFSGGNVPDMQYMEALLGGRSAAPPFMPPHQHSVGFPPAKTPTSQSATTSHSIPSNENKPHNPLGSESAGPALSLMSPIQQNVIKSDAKFNLSGSQGFLNRPPFGSRPFQPGDTIVQGFPGPRFPPVNPTADSRFPYSIDKQLETKQNIAESLLRQSGTNNASSWPFPNLMALQKEQQMHQQPKQEPMETETSGKRETSSSPFPDAARSSANATPVSSSHLSSSTTTASLSGQPKATLTSSAAGGGQQSNLILHPGSPQYHQIFIYQHQLLIMQFQQYQFQLQAQFQQLRIQQMSQQQLMLLSQQFHQQMMLLQQQFNQQQAQLHRMAATGIQFTEPQLNAMYQQQMLTQQAYQQWILALSPGQRLHLQQRMQACMQDVQHQMATIMQQARTDEEHKAPTPAKKPTKPRRPKKKQPAAENPDVPPPKMPIPELSPSMHKLRQIGQHSVSGMLEPPKTKTLESASSASSVTTTAIQPPFSSAIPAAGLVGSVLKPTTTASDKSRQPVVSPTPHVKTPQIGQVNVPPHLTLQMGQVNVPPHLTPQQLQQQQQMKMKNIPNQIEEIQKSFIRQQQSILKGKKEATPPKKEASPMGSGEPRKQMFFPEKFPVHPSQLLRQKWQGSTTPCQSPNIAVSPTMEGVVKPLPSQTMHPPSAPSSAEGLKHPFSSQPGLHQMALDAMQDRTHLPPNQVLVSPPNRQKARHPSNTAGGPTPPQVSPFSMSNILGGSKGQTTSSGDSSFPGHPEMPPHPGIPKVGASFISTAEQQKEAEQKKNLLRIKKKEEKEKVLEEKKKARDLEKQKKMEERTKLKIIREQAKQDKIKEKLLIKQKAMQAKALAIKSKKKAVQTSIQQQKLAMTPKKPPAIISPPPFVPPKPPPVTPKIPLCEPDAQLVYSLVQPLGFSTSKEALDFIGKFGEGTFDGIEDLYSDKPTAPAQDEDALLQPSAGLGEGTTLINDIPLFASPERMELDDELRKLSDSNPPADDNLENNDAEMTAPNEFQEIFKCNNCFGPLQETVFYIDRGFDEVSEGVFDQNDLLMSDQLGFCSNDCVEFYQKKIDYDVNDDIALVDAVKAAAMFSLDENCNFPPLPVDDSRGDVCAPGMDPSKLDKPPEPEIKQRWKRWHYPFAPEKKHNKTRLEREDLYELMSKYDVRLKLSDGIKDRRVCMLCNMTGDGETARASRLLNYDVDKWVHLNCALWSSEVYEALNGGLHNVDKAFARATGTKCEHCHKAGASINCSHTFGAQQRLHCEKAYHFCCALQAQCSLYKDKTILCAQHKMFGVPNEDMRIFTVRRKVYIERDITKQIAKMLSLNCDLDRKEFTFRVGNLIFHELGQIPLNRLDKFTDKENVYPIGFETTSIFWDYHSVRKRRYYTCSISERNRAPLFKLKAHTNGTEGSTFTNTSCKGSWEIEILKCMQKQREKENLLKFFPEFILGQTLFGLLEATVRRMIESLPGIDTIGYYNFRFGRTPLLIAELPLALNPTGCVRSEKFHKHHTIRPLAIRNATSSLNTTESINNDNWLSYPQRTAHILGTKTGQYRRMRQEWRNSVVLGRSRIQGLGLFVKKEVEENTFIIEYIGSLIRNEVANRLEAYYERQNRGIYMFRIDSDCVVDATMTGGPARYINHSCDPNCVAEIVSIEGRKRIIIISSRRIEKGEELTYDYKFELEDDSKKIACLCGATNCRKWMN